MLSHRYDETTQKLSSWVLQKNRNKKQEEVDMTIRDKYMGKYKYSRTISCSITVAIHVDINIKIQRNLLIFSTIGQKMLILGMKFSEFLARRIEQCFSLCLEF